MIFSVPDFDNGRHSCGVSVSSQTSSGASSAGVLSAPGMLSAPLAAHVLQTAAAPSARVPLGQLQPTSVGQLMQQDADLAVSALHVSNELLRSEIQTGQALKHQLGLAQILYEQGVADGMRKAAEFVAHGRSE